MPTIRGSSKPIRRSPICSWARGASIRAIASIARSRCHSARAARKFLDPLDRNQPSRAPFTAFDDDHLERAEPEHASRQPF